jgi:alanine dehydrogenase
MRIGVPTEITPREQRVAITPAGVHTLHVAGHDILVQRGAGLGAGFNDEQYLDAGATLVASAADAWGADLVVKVKEPLAAEYPLLRPGLLLFTFLHLAANRILTERLLSSQTTAIAYETVQVAKRLPLLEPMSEIAGRMGAIVGAHHLGSAQGGSGVLLGGVPGVLPARVTVLGAGTAGINAARMALGLGAEVTVLDIDVERLRSIDLHLHGSLRTVFSTSHALRDLLPTTDLLIGAVLIPGARAPRLVTRELLRSMRPGSVLVDIAIDQGGCAETSRPTTHADPTFTAEGVLHYCVTNMPGAYARTATLALTNATLPYVQRLAAAGSVGLMHLLDELPDLRTGLNTRHGDLFCPGVAHAHDLKLAS